MVTLFADLSHFDNRVAEMDLRPYGKGAEIHSLGGDVFSKITIIELDALSAHRTNIFVGKKRNLSVPVPCVGVIFDSEVLLDAADFDRCLLLAFEFGDIDRQNPELTLHWETSLFVFSSSLISVIVMDLSTALHIS